MNRPGSGQPDEFATRGRCGKRLWEHLHRGVSLFCSSLLAILPKIARLVGGGSFYGLWKMVSIREASIADCDGIGLVTVAASHATFLGAVPEESIDFSWTPAESANQWRATFKDADFDESEFLVAEDEGSLVGLIWVGPDAVTQGYDATVRVLQVRPTAQRRGIGRRLFGRAVEDLRAAGAESLEIGCVRENPSCGFYKRFGGEEIGRHAAKVDKFETEEILFGWTDLAALARLLLTE